MSLPSSATQGHKAKTVPETTFPVVSYPERSIPLYIVSPEWSTTDGHETQADSRNLGAALRITGCPTQSRGCRELRFPVVLVVLVLDASEYEEPRGFRPAPEVSLRPLLFSRSTPTQIEDEDELVDEDGLRF